MRRFWLLFAQAVTVCLGVLFVVTTLRPDWLRSSRTVPVVSAAAPQSYAHAVELAAPSVVNVYTTKQVSEPVAPLLNDPDLARLFGNIPGLTRHRKATTLGSGVIVRSDGYILTNYHVIAAADAIQVALYDGRQAAAELVGADPDSDLAVLRVKLPDLVSIKFSDKHVLRVGDVVLAIGNPFGVGQTTTMGIVSALGRNRLGINTYENFIQTDAAINPGNSGGALVDASGYLVGINTAIYSESGGSLGIGFAIPAAAAHTIMEQIITTGKVTRGWLGIEPQDITPELAQAFRLGRQAGVIIADVLKDGPAWNSGARVGDIVLKIDKMPVQDTLSFLNQIAQLTPGRTVEMDVLRGGRQLHLKVKVGERPRTNPRGR
ncbi:MAG: PDZ domain-containing protein [Burkholderiaceae bacterium]|nr:MAG: PDZ domain-containing protein [Burkholderiaceae bacterium]TAM04648.1 MAG: PDZ domain-containing protein [Pusillimonas sp.]